MIGRARTAVAPAYLLACLIIGGSAQGIWLNMTLQLVGLAIIAWAALDRGDEPLTPTARQLSLIVIAALAVIALQLIPLPGGLWSHLGPRSRLADGFSVLGARLLAQPLSLTPAATLNSLLGLIPPVAIFFAIAGLKAYRPQALAGALIAGLIVGIALGALQVASGGGSSSWYLYRNTNPDRAVGFFANANHMATLLVISIPFVAAIAAAEKIRTMQRYSAVLAILAGLTMVIMVGIALNGSLAGYGLAVPVAAASLLIILPAVSRLRMWILAGAALLGIAALVALQTAPIGGSLGEHATGSVTSRAEILSTTSKAAADFMPFGSGLGSFRSVYHLYEQPTSVTKTFVIHAHNDYAELLLELGLAGAILILLFLAWWAIAVWRVWRTTEPRPFARAAAIASAAILIHSFVDFPLRTAAIGACFAMCLALLADGRAAPPQEKAVLRRKRHVEFK